MMPPINRAATVDLGVHLFDVDICSPFAPILQYRSRSALPLTEGEPSPRKGSRLVGLAGFDRRPLDPQSQTGYFANQGKGQKPLCHKGSRFSAFCTVSGRFAPSRAHSAPIRAVPSRFVVDAEALSNRKEIAPRPSFRAIRSCPRRDCPTW